MARRVSGTEGYGENADALVKQYESISFHDVHRQVLHLLPEPPARVLDVGAGTGRDAAALAAKGYTVTAVEPTAELRERAMALHPEPRIEWLNEGLPDLAALSGRDESYDVVMLTAVWMHLDEAERARAMPRVARLLRRGGVMVLSLRHGPVPPGRRMFEVTVEEMTRAAETEGLEPVLHLERKDGLFGRAEVSWTRLAYRKPA
ncbi:MAG TPA: class I SAM-dependent methyltransferase [Roseomonas sp.]|nr:class I SAM-dependent methyltransferase [Roseomonas sp.]